MRRLLAAPSLAIALFVLWLLLTQSLAAGTILLGLVLALFWAAMAARFDTGGRSPRRPVVMAKLFVPETEQPKVYPREQVGDLASVRVLTGYVTEAMRDLAATWRR